MPRVSLAFLLVGRLCLLAQAPITPKPPFTAAEAERGKAIAQKSAEIRRDIKNMRDPAEPFPNGQETHAIRR